MKNYTFFIDGGFVRLFFGFTNFRFTLDLRVKQILFLLLLLSKPIVSKV